MNGFPFTVPPLLYIGLFYVLFLVLLGQCVFILIQSGGLSRGHRILMVIVGTCLVGFGAWSFFHYPVRTATLVSGKPIVPTQSIVRAVTPSPILPTTVSLSVTPRLSEEVSSGTVAATPVVVAQSLPTVTPLRQGDTATRVPTRPTATIIIRNPTATIPAQQGVPLSPAPAVVVQPKVPLAGSTEVTIVSSILGMLIITAGLLL